MDEIQHSGIAVTRAHNLKSRIIVHINADRFSDSWDDGIEECLEVAERNGVNTIAMPAFGTGDFVSNLSLLFLCLFTCFCLFLFGFSENCFVLGSFIVVLCFFVVFVFGGRGLFCFLF